MSSFVMNAHFDMQVVDGKIKVQYLNLKVEALKFFIIQSLPFSIQVVIVITNPR